MPKKSDYQKKLVKSGNLVSKSKVENHVKGSGNKGTEKEHKGDRKRLHSKTKNELYDMAKDRDISGRSKMNKEQLAEVLKS